LTGIFGLEALGKLLSLISRKKRGSFRRFKDRELSGSTRQRMIHGSQEKDLMGFTVDRKKIKK